MLRVIVIIFAICCCSVFGEKIFWGHDICTMDADCTSFLHHCDSTFGCTISGVKIIFLFLGISFGFIFICCLLIILRNIRCHSHNQDLPQTVSTTSGDTFKTHGVHIVHRMHRPMIHRTHIHHHR